MSSQVEEPKYVQKMFFTEGLYIFETGHWAQCRNEMPFQVKFHFPRGNKDTAFITCPHCGRNYYQDWETGSWIADRPLVFMTEDCLEEVRAKAIR